MAGHPGITWGLHALALWVWHLPLLYESALRSEVVHAAEHVSFAGTAVLYWWVVAECGAPRRMDRAVGVLYVFTIAMQGGILGALMTFSAAPWYPAYAASATAWGLTPLEDQQLAGLIMWVPSGLVYLAAALVLLVGWLRMADAAAIRREHRLRRVA